MLKTFGKKGQTEIIDGLILLLIAATCGVALLSIAGDYGSLPLEIYRDNYAQKLAQNSLLSTYHITDQDQDSVDTYRKSLMVGVSEELSKGNSDLKNSVIGNKIQDLLNMYYQNLGWHFMFGFLDGGTTLMDETIISSNPQVTSSATFDQQAGGRSCASAALTYPQGDCTTGGGGEAGDMCYGIFEICVWQS